MDKSSAAHTPAELQKRIDALLDEGLATDEVLARLEAPSAAQDDRQEAARRFVRLMWPLIHEFHGARVTLRSILRLARKQRAA